MTVWKDAAGRIFDRIAAGGHGGGVTGYVDVSATEQQIADFLGAPVGPTTPEPEPMPEPKTPEEAPSIGFGIQR
jgi:hypothetical protein